MLLPYIGQGYCCEVEADALLTLWEGLTAVAEVKLATDELPVSAQQPVGVTIVLSSSKTWRGMST